MNSGRPTVTSPVPLGTRVITRLGRGATSSPSSSDQNSISTPASGPCTNCSLGSQTYQATRTAEWPRRRRQLAWAPPGTMSWPWVVAGPTWPAPDASAARSADSAAGRSSAGTASTGVELRPERTAKCVTRAVSRASTTRSKARARTSQATGASPRSARTTRPWYQRVRRTAAALCLPLALRLPPDSRTMALARALDTTAAESLTVLRSSTGTRPAMPRRTATGSTLR
ncbi:hypothetical protein ACFQZC_36850 [Streptacidiphilus monticola]